MEEGEVDPLSAPPPPPMPSPKDSEQKKPAEGEDSSQEQQVTVFEAIMGTIRGHAVKNLRADSPTASTSEAASAKVGARDPSLSGSGEVGGDWGGAEYWQDEHWRLALEELFYNNRDKRKEKQDDMVFYVFSKSAAAARDPKKGGRKRGGKGDASGDKDLDVTVRRFGTGIPSDLDLPGIRWMESVYLNILLHTTYTCTVAICSKSALERHKSGAADPALPVSKMSRQVFASHTHISINLTQTKCSLSPELAYPQVYFSIDDFEDAFEDLIVEDEDHCLCVLLYARDGPTFKWKGSAAMRNKDGDGPGRAAQAGKAESKAGRSNNLGQNTKVSLFSGYVPYSHLWKAVRRQARGNNVGNFLGFSNGNQVSNEQPEKLVMRGPGGKGHAEVAVTLLNRKTTVHADPPPVVAPDQAQDGASESGSSKRGLKGLFSAMQTNIASNNRPMVLGRGGGNKNNKPKLRTTQHIRCCLMNVSLPWQSLCHDILKSSTL